MAGAAIGFDAGKSEIGSPAPRLERRCKDPRNSPDRLGYLDAISVAIVAIARSPPYPSPSDPRSALSAGSYSRALIV